MENVRDLRRKAAEKRLSAKRHLHQVIFGDYGGEGKGELDTTPETVKKIFNGNTFKDSCGGNGDKMAGKSLINDFICLCAKWIKLDAVFNSHQDHSICKYGVTTAVEKDFKNWTDVWYFNKHRICINTAPLTPTPKIINSMVAHFTRMVDRDQTNFTIKGVFGFYNHSGKDKPCDASEQYPGNTCVNYKHALENGGIQWVNRLKNASKDLEDMERLNKKSESSLPQLELLEHNAILLYEEAKYSTQLPHANETAFKSTNESYEDILANDTNTLEKLEEEDDSDSTWKGGPSLCGFFFFLFVF
ncbi:Variant surface glycoprotein [Trypanosoma congolense IL3000]|uniref:Variant surface glycoprotein n=1 Tax=Trypanosoma congolense (strain IL3000) TaxID=1068625 RepID=F9WDA9_TRYCI|nr:Variant surface glycoprotein [Trypanosoma congolense IL3000]